MSTTNTICKSSSSSSSKRRLFFLMGIKKHIFALLLVVIFFGSTTRRVASAWAPPPLKLHSPHSSSLSLISDSTSIAESSWLTIEQLDAYSKEKGIVLTLSTLGLGYRAIARAAHNESLILGYCEGFVRPGERNLVYI
mmetsp:Transcript_27762/g.42729  ORF Transcript_27762/g.42729 Transcript_27762/m.42729 type:complete len:138 (-) Transcript_27762:640-1053(-)